MRWSPSEDQEQANLMAWARVNEGVLPELVLLFHVPNGGDRHPAVAARLKAMGTKPGVPDLLLPVARGGYHGLALEMKSPTGKGRVRPEQAAWLTALREEGWATAVRCSWVDAANTIMLYLRGEHPRNEG